MNAVTDVKGWCPGIIRPMASGDGLIVRVRPRCGAFSLETAAVLADLADAWATATSTSRVAPTCSFAA